MGEESWCPGVLHGPSWFQSEPPQTDSSHKPLMLLARGPGFGEPLPSVVGKDEVVGIS